MKKNKEPFKDFVFKKNNYIVMLVGILFIAIGFILMSGGGSEDPNVFNEEIYNFRRIRLAPTLVLIGFGIQVYAILLNPRKK
ncbi:MAG: DUF3098 domain-containing protein [Flavobacteriaceae bacterium]|nr:DUF3098 domain-containing protein [Flavobacteriaceae bacterium]